VADERQLEKRVADLSRQLAAAVQDLETFSHAVSHDLRAPLRAIDNFSSILNEEYADELDPEARRLIGIVRKNAARMGTLIRDILAFAHAGRRELILADIDLEALLRDVVDELKPSFAGRQVAVQLQALPHIRADTADIRKVWLNLLANAIKFTRPRELAQIEVHACVAGDEVIMGIAGHVSRAMLARYSHVRMEAKRRALDEIAARQRKADEKRQQEIAPQQVGITSQSAVVQ